MRLRDINNSLWTKSAWAGIVGAQGSLMLREFASREPYPLAVLHGAIMELLALRDDIVIFGAQAVNAYVPEPRMTQDVDVLSTNAADVAEAVRAELNRRFHIAVRVREFADRNAYVVYRLARPKNIKLADIRQVDALPPTRKRMGLPVVMPAQLIAGKVKACVARRGRPKSLTDRRDIAVLLLAFPKLKTAEGAVRRELQSLGVSREVFDAWDEIVRTDMHHDDEEDGY